MIHDVFDALDHDALVDQYRYPVAYVEQCVDVVSDHHYGQIQVGAQIAYQLIEFRG